MLAHPTAPAIIDAKIHPPRGRSEEVTRSRLIRDLTDARDARVISIAAPPGYGKTTLLAQWTRAKTRPVAWLTIDAADNDVVSLFSYLAAAVDRVAPVDPGPVRKLASPGLPPYAIARLFLTALPRSGEDVLVVLDDVHLLTDYSCLDALGAWIDGLPEGWQVAIAGRVQPNLRIGRWRSSGALDEVGTEDLTLDRQECDSMARSLGLHLSEEESRHLAMRSEGWPAGVYLAILAIKRSRTEPRSVVPASGEPYLADYIRSEVLGGLDPDVISFLGRTAFLERLTPSLCDAVLETDGSGEKLEALATANSLVVRLGGSRGWYRYHTLLREHLQSDFERDNPALTHDLHRRAGIWYAEHGLPEQGVVELLAAGDDDHAAKLLGSAAWDLFYSGRAGTVRSLGDRFDEAALARHPWLATWLCWSALFAGQIGRVARMADIVDGAAFSGVPPDGSASFESGRAMLSVYLARHGPDRMRADADVAISAEPSWSPWRSLALTSSAIASMALDDDARAEAELREAVDVAHAASASDEEQGALALLALLMIGKGDWGRATSMTDRANKIMRASNLESYFTTVITHAASARVALHRGDIAATSAILGQAQVLRPLLTSASAWFSVRCLLELGRVYVAMSDRDGARAVLAQAEDIVRKRPLLGPVVAEVRGLQEQLRDMPAAFGGSSGLTASELRVLAFLPFHLSYREIADRLGVKESTVKTHTIAIYGKFGVSTRGDAIEVASSIGLIAGIPA